MRDDSRPVSSTCWPRGRESSRTCSTSSTSWHACERRSSGTRAGCGHHELAEQAVRLTERTGREKENVRRAGGCSVTEGECPQAVDHDRPAVGGFELALRCHLAVAAMKVERVDMAVAEVPHEQG